jgi:hypothetical protein
MISWATTGCAFGAGATTVGAAAAEPVDAPASPSSSPLLHAAKSMIANNPTTMIENPFRKERIRIRPSPVLFSFLGHVGCTSRMRLKLKYNIFGKYPMSAKVTNDILTVKRRSSVKILRFK